jgi:hypothetical protein
MNFHGGLLRLGQRRQVISVLRYRLEMSGLFPFLGELEHQFGLAGLVWPGTTTDE